MGLKIKDTFDNDTHFYYQGKPAHTMMINRLAGGFDKNSESDTSHRHEFIANTLIQHYSKPLIMKQNGAFSYPAGLILIKAALLRSGRTMYNGFLF